MPSSRVHRLPLGPLDSLAAVLVVGIAAGLFPPRAETIHHDLDVSLRPEAYTLSVEDFVSLPAPPPSRTVRFLLHAGLAPDTQTPGVEIVREKEAISARDLAAVFGATRIAPGAARMLPGAPATMHRAGDLGNKGAPDLPDDLPLDIPANVPLDLFRATLPPETKEFLLKYGGKIHHQIEQGEDYARGFSETPGIIEADGVYLAKSSCWYPLFLEPESVSGTPLVTFSLDIALPPGWDAMSQGERRVHSRADSSTHVSWDCSDPQDDIYLIAGHLTETSRKAGPVLAMAFLRAPNDNLASKYLETTGQYLEMYGTLLGPYPYKKFALVENFWETGYGMPSFTLLGSKVIQLPFILNTSYPHEILHNWWGNGVFVDDRRGNWSEGLTAYLADHLFQEQRGADADYRQMTLQKYADYVSRSKDFPLTAFRERRNPATEAVGYGKALMFFHGLRLGLGDEVFIAALRSFYERNLFRRASWDDLRAAFEEVSGKNLAGTFSQAIERTGAPKLSIGGARARPPGDAPGGSGAQENLAQGDGWVLSATLEQVQPEGAYRLAVPIAVTLEGREDAWQQRLPMDGKHLDIRLSLPARPLRVDVDPEFDLFRRLDRNEIPPALSQAFGAEKATVLLPASAPPDLLAAWRALAEDWSRGQPGKLDVKMDSEVEKIPTDRTVWLFGWENRFHAQVASMLKGYDAAVSDDGLHDGVRVETASLPRADHSFAIVTRHPGNSDLALAWIAADHAAAVPGLGKKLPHYHNYSWLGFEGDEPTNVAKGRWPVVDSPLTILVGSPSSNDLGAAKVERAKLAPRSGLASVPSAFSRERMMATVGFLSSPDLRGRGFGSAGLDLAADFIARKFQEAGLKPPGDSPDSSVRSWIEHGGDPERAAPVKNIIGIIPGSKPEWAGQSVVVGAHYDHLGLGWPDARGENKGKVHPGADDNASGVAVLLELARVLRQGWTPDRTVVLVAFGGEEAGRLGSRRYVETEARFPARSCIGMVNLDTVGRLGSRKLLVLGTGSASEWTHIFDGAGYVTGVSVEPVAADYGSSDQKSFLDAGIPAVQLFTGPHVDYHAPGDTPDKIDADGLAKVAAVAREAIEYLAARPEPMTVTLAGGAGNPATETRKVGLGTIPDFAYSGRGVRLSGVVPGSPADKAGMKEGDIVVRVALATIKDLRSFSDALKTLSPGEKIPVTFLRDGKELTIETEVVAR